ncbi:MAG: hypothetical protein LRY73_14845 [Bacillus sp. (in: Bacteria)]|nr:hypothetical protein [Bacillus sp. (in: firmicutes)]
MEKNTIEQLLEEYLGKRLDYYGTICFSEQKGVEMFHEWLETGQWGEHLPLTEQEQGRYAPAIICYCFRAIRKRMIKRRLFFFA